MKRRNLKSRSSRKVPNPLLRDPTRTSGIRNEFASAIKGQFAKFQAAVVKYLRSILSDLPARILYSQDEKKMMEIENEDSGTNGRDVEEDTFNHQTDGDARTHGRGVQPTQRIPDGRGQVGGDGSTVAGENHGYHQVDNISVSSFQEIFNEGEKEDSRYQPGGRFCLPCYDPRKTDGGWGEWELIGNNNPNHDELGRFASGDGAKLPPVGTKVKIGKDTYWTEPFDGDDTFPPAIAHYEVKDGHIFYTGRNGSEGVVTGTKEESAKWMKQVRDEIQRHPPEDHISHEWTSADSGKENVEAAKAMVNKTAEKFGIDPPTVKLNVSKRPLEAGEHTGNQVSLANPHLNTENTSLNFKTDTSHEVAVAAHETMHSVYSADSELGRKYQDKLANSGETVSVYHSLAGHFEGLMDLGGAYVHSPEQLKSYSPKLHKIADDWSRETRGLSVNVLLYSSFQESLAVNASDDVKDFESWLSQQADGTITGKKHKELWRRYVGVARQKGLERAYDDANAKGSALAGALPDAGHRLSQMEGSKNQFLSSSGQGESGSVIDSAFKDLKTAMRETNQEMSRTLLDGIAFGEHPSFTFAKVQKVIAKGKRRALAVAQVAAVKSYTSAQLDVFEALGMSKAGVMAEFVTAEDACSECAAFAGEEYDIEDARGLLPIHVGCRCAWVPTVKD